jgi:hypothetical protein
MRTARTLEAEWRQVLRENVGTGAKEDELSTGLFRTAGFHRITARSRLEHDLNVYLFNFPILGEGGAALNRE